MWISLNVRIGYLSFLSNPKSTRPSELLEPRRCLSTPCLARSLPQTTAVRCLPFDRIHHFKTFPVSYGSAANTESPIISFADYDTLQSKSLNIIIADPHWQTTISRRNLLVKPAKPSTATSAKRAMVASTNTKHTRAVTTTHIDR